MENNQLTELPAHVLQPLTSLQLLYMGSNNVSHLFADTFANMSALSDL